MSLNCKPGQMASIVRRSNLFQCVNTMLGLPVKVDQQYRPETFSDALLEQIDGPIWTLHYGVRCTQCGTEFHLMPDRCLLPWSPDSEPSEDHEGSEPDVKLEQPVVEPAGGIDRG